MFFKVENELFKMLGVGLGVGWVLLLLFSKDNGGVVYCSLYGLIVYGVGSSVVVMEFWIM